MPPEAPVTSAVLPERLNIKFVLSLRGFAVDATFS